MKKVIPLFLLLFLSVLYPACTPDAGRMFPDLSAIPAPDVRVHRYDQALFAIPLNNLQQQLEQIKPSYAFFLDTDLSDTAKLNNLREYLTNLRTREFHQATEARYSSLDWLERDLSSAFQYLHHYFPGYSLPRVYSFISGGDYKAPVQFYDSVILIALDTYLGPDYKPYGADGIPVYKRMRMSSEYIVPDCIRSLQPAFFPVEYPGNTLLDHMVDAGKRVWFVDAMLPGYPDQYKLSYTHEQMNWALEHEQHIWAAIIENRLLYSSQGSTLRTFLADGPFTADFSASSPPRLGEFLGWRIVKAYMESHPEVTLHELIHEQNAQKILTGSRYKPEK